MSIFVLLLWLATTFITVRLLIGGGGPGLSFVSVEEGCVLVMYDHIGNV